ncbi:hypothetical protein EDB81DRAFT_63000 [Dactylonectria macrodidyma]|uniref:Uncharacterized protein n=1 Tax=Dactylonectria macrodidyma TaxID=307937 RepID=A0A9P9EP45_9HYPO|nr:hypothetical protein EDB81DRAFT_63000 [Dactylonectria macrodidyma]
MTSAIQHRIPVMIHPLSCSLPTLTASARSGPTTRMLLLLNSGNRIHRLRDMGTPGHGVMGPHRRARTAGERYFTMLILQGMAGQACQGDGNQIHSRTRTVAGASPPDLGGCAKYRLNTSPCMSFTLTLMNERHAITGSVRPHREKRWSNAWPFPSPDN